MRRRARARGSPARRGGPAGRAGAGRRTAGRSPRARPAPSTTRSQPRTAASTACAAPAASPTMPTRTAPGGAGPSQPVDDRTAQPDGDVAGGVGRRPSRARRNGPSAAADQRGGVGAPGRPELGDRRGRAARRRCAARCPSRCAISALVSPSPTRCEQLALATGQQVVRRRGCAAPSGAPRRPAASGAPGRAAAACRGAEIRRSAVLEDLDRRPSRSPARRVASPSAQAQRSSPRRWIRRPELAPPAGSCRGRPHRGRAGARPRSRDGRPAASGTGAAARAARDRGRGRASAHARGDPEELEIRVVLGMRQQHARRCSSAAGRPSAPQRRLRRDPRGRDAAL